MKCIWQRRLWNIGAALLGISLAALGLAAVLAFSGDVAGQQFATGIAAVTGLGFVADLIALVGLVTLQERDGVIDHSS